MRIEKRIVNITNVDAAHARVEKESSVTMNRNESVRRNRRAREEEHPRVRLRRHRGKPPRLRARQRQPRRRGRDRRSLTDGRLGGALRKSVADGRPARRTRAPHLQQPPIHALRVKRVAARQRPQRLPALVLAEAHVTLRSLRVGSVGDLIAGGGRRVRAAGAIGVAGGARQRERLGGVDTTGKVTLHGDYVVATWWLRRGYMTHGDYVVVAWWLATTLQTLL